MRRTIALCGLWSSVVGTGCGDDFEPISEVRGLRVLAVQKDPVFARPGSSVELRMLWADAAANGAREVQRAWVGGCHNPLGDLFTGCVDSLSAAASGLAAGEATTDVGFGDRFTLNVPQDVITSREPPSDPAQPPYGLSFVFFAACAGRLGPLVDPRPGEIPLGCYDDAGALRGADDFVVGFSQVLSYVSLANDNPAVMAVRIAGRDVPIDCFGDACLDSVDEEPIDCGAGDPRCISVCADDGDPDECPKVRLDPLFAGQVGEVDPIGSAAESTTVYEHVWVNYFVDRGGVGSATRIVIDSELGPRDDFATDLFAPAAPGPMRMWVSVHDSRGGAGWARLRLLVEP